MLTGILVSASERELRMVATDSYRLSVKETTAGGAALVRLRGQRAGARPPGAGSARRPRARTRRSASASAPTRSCSPSAGSSCPRGSSTASSPTTGSCCRRPSSTSSGWPGGEFTDVVRRISLLAQKNAPLRLAFAPGELTVSAQTPDVGEASESLPVGFQGEPLEIGFNPEFLRAGLEAIDEGDVLLKLISPLRPGLIEAADESRFRYLIMPIRLNV